MKYLLTGIILCCLAIESNAQNTFKIVLKGGEEKHMLAGATVIWKEKNRSFAADSTGTVTISGVPDGPQTFIISYVGFQERSVTYTFPLSSDAAVEIDLEEEEGEEEEEVIVTATRTSRTIANTPTRTEVISGEELAEKANMKPGDIRMLLSESTGIQTQQTSATSFNAGIRIQGLDGRYTQLLRDGYPLYSGFSGGLSILQIAPLDLKQVEVIKGSSSTLYGGGAIAGLVNLVSRTPGKERELSFIGNATSARGLDLSGFYSERYGKTGMTIYAARNSNAAFDPANIGLTAIPEFQRYTINPRLFLYGNKTTADIGVSFIAEDRTGGNMNYIKNGGPGFFERNKTNRITTQAGIAHRLSEKTTLQFKNSYSRFDRKITIPSSRFEGVQQSSFSELTWNRKGEKADWVIGANVLTDDLQEQRQSGNDVRDYHYNTYGIFVQNAWAPAPKFVLEAGLRGDFVNEYGFELLPRVSVMYRISPKVTTRLGGGLGYKTPSIFTEETERIQYRNLMPIDVTRTRNERSEGVNWDINYRTQFGDLGFSINHMLFFTRLHSPLVLVGVPGGKSELRNASGHYDTKGMETNMRLMYGHFKLFVGYTHTDANRHFDNGKEWLTLTARHRLNNVLMYEIEDKLKIGLEGYYFSPQKLSDGAMGKSYWIMGFMVEKIWEKFAVYINFENFTDSRQTRFDSINTGTAEAPIFRDIYAPVEGFVINGGIKIRL